MSGRGPGDPVADSGPSAGGKDPDDDAVLMRRLKQGGFAFLDIGCGSGDSMKWAAAAFPSEREGLGIDIDPAKIRAARAAGRKVLNTDVTRLADRDVVDFSILSHVLEHLSGIDQARAFIRAACLAARRFVLIKQPWFDDDGRLMEHGLKLYWSDWTGHRFAMSTLQMYRVLRDLQDAGEIAGFSIHAKKPIPSSESPHVLPLATPVDQHSYDRERHGPKGGGRHLRPATGAGTRRGRADRQGCGHRRDRSRRLSVRTDALPVSDVVMPPTSRRLWTGQALGRKRPPR